MYIDKLDDIVNKYNNTYHRKIKMKPVDGKPSKYIDSSKKINYQDPKFKIGDIVWISKYINILAKGYIPNWSNEFLTTLRRGHAFIVLNSGEIVETLHEKELRKTNRKEFTI